METWIIPGEPAPWTIYTRQGKPTNGFLDMKAWQAVIQAHVKVAWNGQDLITEPVHLEMEFYRGTPRNQETMRAANLFQWQLEHIQRPPDWLNYFKAAEDALKGILFKDDSLVLSGKGLKWYTDDEVGFTIIRMRQLTRSETSFGTRIGWAKVNK